MVDKALETFRASDSADAIRDIGQQAASSLDTSYGHTYNDSYTPMFRKTVGEESNFRPVSDQLFSPLTAAARAQGADVIRGGEYADSRLTNGRRAVTLGDLLVFGKDVCKSDIHEELRHLWQNRTGFNMDISDEYERALRNEIDAKEYLIEHARDLAIPRMETYETTRELELYQNALEVYLDTGKETL